MMLTQPNHVHCEYIVKGKATGEYPMGQVKSQLLWITGVHIQSFNTKILNIRIEDISVLY